MLNNKFENLGMLEWKNFLMKLKMLTRELKAFSEVFSEVRKLEKWHVKNLDNKTNLANSYSEVEMSDKEKFGFFLPVTKTKKLVDLKVKIEENEQNLRVGEELLKLVYYHLVDYEMQTMRKQKKQRLEEIWVDFSKTKIQKIQNELSFWKGLVQARIPNLDVREYTQEEENDS